MRLVRFAARTAHRDSPVGKGRVRVNPSRGLQGIGVAWWIYTLRGLKASADFHFRKRSRAKEMSILGSLLIGALSIGALPYISLLYSPLHYLRSLTLPPLPLLSYLLPALLLSPSRRHNCVVLIQGPTERCETSTTASFKGSTRVPINRIRNFSDSPKTFKNPRI